MCSAAPRIRNIAANTQRMRLEVDPELDRLAEHKARIEAEHREAMRANQRGFWLVAAIVVVIVLKVAGLLP